MNGNIWKKSGWHFRPRFDLEGELLMPTSIAEKFIAFNECFTGLHLPFTLPTAHINFNICN
jgi:hypothetical protein